MKFKKGFKKFAKCYFIAFVVFAILGWSQSNAFMDSEEIVIEGKIYPKERNTTNSTDDMNSDEKVPTKKDIKFFPKEFPKTNQKQSELLTSLGLIIAFGALGFILSKNKLDKEK